MPESNRDYHSSMRSVKIHDVILLEKGELVYCKDVPAYFSKGADPYSTRRVDTLLHVGEPLFRPVSSHILRANIADSITELFLYHRLPLQTDILNRFLAHQIKEIPNDTFLVPDGLYTISSIFIERKGRKFFCKTYRPAEGMSNLEIYFYVESNHAANHNSVKVVIDAERDI